MAQKQRATKEQKEQLQGWETEVDYLQERFERLLDKLQAKKIDIRSAKYTHLKQKLEKVQGVLNRLNALVMDEALKTDDPDQPLTDVTF